MDIAMPTLLGAGQRRELAREPLRIHARAGEFKATLYARGKPPVELSLEGLAQLHPDDDQLAWVALCRPSAQTLHAVHQVLGLPRPVREFLADTGSAPTLRNFRSCFGVQVINAQLKDDLRFEGEVITVVCAPNLVLTVTTRSCDHLTQLRERQRLNTDIGVLSAESFMVALLDGQLNSYAAAMARLEGKVDQLEVNLLTNRQDDCLEALGVLRKAASKLRRNLSAHREVFGGLARPDFRPRQSDQIHEHFSSLQSRYERAMDHVEHGRDIVAGTFQLFSTRAAMSTNESMRTLTFATVLIGALAVIAGILGMNFNAPFFGSGQIGFWTTVSAMLVLVAGAVWLARRRQWL